MDATETLNDTNLTQLQCAAITMLAVNDIPTLIHGRCTRDIGILLQIRFQ